ncbi:Protein N-terminal and lysine N-methyltransferase efm7 [Elasticomyces elasticus]|nr:Protein N-terminal and lysine N-methyltransferase efm7 [Elasticomyces elasticus]
MSADGDLGTMFEEPEGFYKPEKQPTFVTHTLPDGRELQLRLVGQNPLWGHYLWNAGRTISDVLYGQPTESIKGTTVLELGAGAGLPGLTCALKGAACVVVTDYPDEELIENIRYNITHCSLLPDQTSVHTQGYLWGASTDSLLSLLPASNESGFDVLILADLLFNHSEHGKLVSSIQKTLKKTSEARAFVFFTPYRPWLLQKDLAFFDLAKAAGFTVEKTLEKVMDKVMFEEDPGDELLRRTVYGYELRWA